MSINAIVRYNAQIGRNL